MRKGHADGRERVPECQGHGPPHKLCVTQQPWQRTSSPNDRDSARPMTFLKDSICTTAKEKVGHGLPQTR